MHFTLSYFDSPASRGEECRLALHHAGLEFTDDRIKDWPSRRASTPFGALPVLTAEGHGQIAQTNTILRLVGRLHGLHPSDPWEAARHEAIMASVEDMRGRLNPITRIKDPEEKRRAREEVASGYLQEWAGALEKLVGPGPFVGGAALHVVDLKLYVALSPFVRGAMDHIPADVFKAFPRLLGVYEAVKAHPRTRSWQERASAK